MRLKLDIVACDRCGQRGYNKTDIGKKHDTGIGSPEDNCRGTLAVMPEQTAWELEQAR